MVDHAETTESHAQKDRDSAELKRILRSMDKDAYMRFILYLSDAGKLQVSPCPSNPGAVQVRAP